MVRLIAVFGMAALFLLISGDLRATAAFGLGQATLEIAKYSPYSYILLALALGAGAMRSLATPKPQ